ncbi:MAG TPA: PHP-associated domain-containing protein [Candidatus Saccharimonadales bacterium]|nr:PHP-associated domain-containing protein [Candidatus Saccharimonadales bacterium]
MDREAEHAPARTGATGKADLQIHSDLGDGLASPAAILDTAERVGLDVIALTDHDDIRGAFQLRDIAARRASPVEIVTGIEVTTRSGHLLALFIETDIPMFRPLSETVLAIHRAGGVAIVPHPLSYLTFSIGERALRRLALLDDPDSFIDGIELKNPSYAGRVRDGRAARLNQHVLRVAETGSSDAHHGHLVGTAWTAFPGRDAAALRAAITACTTTAHGRDWTMREHLDGAAKQQWRSMVRDPYKRVRTRVGPKRAKRQ